MYFPVPDDFGPIYAETDLSRFPVEPWNTFSNIIFLIIIVLFIKKTKLNYRTHPSFIISLPILTIGFIGGTVFHATRSHQIWLAMDYIPITILSLFVSYIFWVRLTYRRIISVLLIFLPFILVRLVFLIPNLDIKLKITGVYSMLALSILAPLYLHHFRLYKDDFVIMLSSTLFFILAIFFRYQDKNLISIFPMGSHFLWHLLGGASVWCLAEYIYRVEKKESQRAIL